MKYSKDPIIRIDDDSIIYQGHTWYTPKGYNRVMKLSERSTVSPYNHAKADPPRAESFKFFTSVFFRPIM